MTNPRAAARRKQADERKRRKEEVIQERQQSARGKRASGDSYTNMLKTGDQGESKSSQRRGTFFGMYSPDQGQVKAQETGAATPDISTDSGPVLTKIKIHKPEGATEQKTVEDSAGSPASDNGSATKLRERTNHKNSARRGSFFGMCKSNALHTMLACLCVCFVQYYYIYADERAVTSNVSTYSRLNPPSFLFPALCSLHTCNRCTRQGAAHFGNKEKRGAWGRRGRRGCWRGEGVETQHMAGRQLPAAARRRGGRILWRFRVGGGSRRENERQETRRPRPFHEARLVLWLLCVGRGE